jgi:hypothetical protein
MELLAEALSERERIESIAGVSLAPPKAAPLTDDIIVPSSAPPPSSPEPVVKSTNGSPAASLPPKAVSLAPLAEQQPAPSLQPEAAEAVSVRPAAPTPSVRPAPASAPPVDRATARDQLLEIIAREPYRADAIRKLHNMTAHEPKTIEAQVACSLLAAFDPEVSAPGERQFHSGVWRGDALQTALSDGLPVAARRMLARLWEASRTLPRFRMTPASAGLTERDRLAQRAVGLVAETYAQAARLLGARDVPVFETSAEGPRDSGRIVAAHPPFVLVHAALATARPSRSGLLWTFGRALQLALPDQVFGGALAAQDARDLLYAAALAFSPRTAEGLVTPQIKELAASLWQNVPAGEQRNIANALATHRAEIGLEALITRAEATAARAGLLCSGNIYEALKSVAHSDPKLAGLTVHDAVSFSEACKRSSAYAATVQCAVSPELRAALALARASR